VFATQVNSKKIMVKKIDDKILATSATCTHKDVDLTKRGIFDEEYVTCTNHLATFDMTTGEVVQPPATQPLEIFEIRIKNEKVFLIINGDV
jgi:3-phenylpropionate/trans-cinnamate dioxygenase ferredoxin subunit